MDRMLDSLVDDDENLSEFFSVVLLGSAGGNADVLELFSCVACINAIRITEEEKLPLPHLEIS